MEYGLKAWDAFGNVIIDGFSRMARLHAEGSHVFSLGGWAEETWQFPYSGLSIAPMIIYEIDVDDFPASLIFTDIQSGGQYIRCDVHIKAGSGGFSGTMQLFIMRRN